MKDNLSFETFLYISPKRFIISVNNGINENIYKDEQILRQNTDNLIFNDLDLFLNKNIFKIEKKLKKFITKIHIILDSNDFFSVEISIKKSVVDKSFTLKNLKTFLIEAKESCEKTINAKKIAHMLISNYQIDDKNYPYLPQNETGNNFSIDVKFICISNFLINNFEEIFKKYQVSLGQVVSAKYIEKFILDEKKSIFLMAKEIIEGHNQNEVKMVNKSSKNKGFFEKFFNFFS